MSLDCECDLGLISKVLSGITVQDALNVVEADKIKAKADADEEKLDTSDLKSPLTPDMLKSMYKIGFSNITAKEEYESWTNTESELMFSEHKRICASFFSYKNSLSKLERLDRRVDHKPNRKVSSKYYLTRNLDGPYLPLLDKLFEVLGLVSGVYHIIEYLYCYFPNYSLLNYVYSMLFLLFWHFFFIGLSNLLRLRKGTHIISEQCFFFPEDEAVPISQYQVREENNLVNYKWIFPVPKIYRQYYPHVDHNKRMSSLLNDYHTATLDKKFKADLNLKKVLSSFIRDQKDVRSGKDADYDLINPVEFGFKAQIIRSIYLIRLDQAMVSKVTLMTSLLKRWLVAPS